MLVSTGVVIIAAEDVFELGAVRIRAHFARDGAIVGRPCRRRSCCIDTIVDKVVVVVIVVVLVVHMITVEESAVVGAGVMRNAKSGCFGRIEEVVQLLMVVSILFGLIGREALSIRRLSTPRIQVSRVFGFHAEDAAAGMMMMNGGDSGGAVDDTYLMVRERERMQLDMVGGCWTAVPSGAESLVKQIRAAIGWPTASATTLREARNGRRLMSAIANLQSMALRGRKSVKSGNTERNTKGRALFVIV